MHTQCLVGCFSGVGYDSPNESPAYDTKQSDGEAPVMLEFGGIRSAPSLQSLTMARSGST